MPVNPALPIGSWVYRNWRAQLASAPELSAEEVQLYTDARFTGEVRSGLGPYLLLNTSAEPHEPGTVVPALVLRIGAHIADHTDHVVRAFQAGIPDANSFTGGTTYEELASLISLAHRVRVAVGSVTRWFHPHDTDPRGTPRHSAALAPAVPAGRHQKVIPELRRSVTLNTELLATYPTIPWESARELARAARSYRQGVWLANGDGNLAWLFLVSAAETAANEWARVRRQPELTPTELLTDLHVEYAQRLEIAGGENAAAVLREVAQSQLEVLRGQWKFREFLTMFGQHAPTPRPRASAIDWTAAGLKRILGVVYKYRSSALHASTPFPLPMCDSPLPMDSESGTSAWAEKPGGAAYHMGGLWTESQLPINLYAFHHLVATSLQNWWRDLANDPSINESAPAG